MLLDRLKDLRSLKLSEIRKGCVNDAINKWNGNCSGSGSVSNTHISVKHGKEMDHNSKEMGHNSLEPSQNTSS